MNIFIILLVLLFSSITSADPLHNIVVFGDSLSDNGNLYKASEHRIPASPPYYEGRFSNGQVWVEHLINSYFPIDGAKYLEDYAFGGAALSDDTTENDGAFTLNYEINTYLLAHQDKASPDSLFIVWIGANNYLALPNDVEKTVSEVNASLIHGLERLAKTGAKHILVLNLPDLGKTPAARQLGKEERLSSYSKHHNELLEQSFSRLQEEYPDTQWIYFNAEHAVNEILSSPYSYGFTNVYDTCYNLKLDKPSKRLIITMAAQPNATKKDNKCTGYLFFDPVHSTTLAHQVIAEQVRSQLDSLGIELTA